MKNKHSEFFMQSIFWPVSQRFLGRFLKRFLMGTALLLLPFLAGCQSTDGAAARTDKLAEYEEEALSHYREQKEGTSLRWNYHVKSRAGYTLLVGFVTTGVEGCKAAYDEKIGAFADYALFGAIDPDELQATPPGVFTDNPILDGPDINRQTWDEACAEMVAARALYLGCDLKPDTTFLLQFRTEHKRRLNGPIPRKFLHGRRQFGGWASSYIRGRRLDWGKDCQTTG